MLRCCRARLAAVLAAAAAVQGRAAGAAMVALAAAAAPPVPADAERMAPCGGQEEQEPTEKTANPGLTVLRPLPPTTVVLAVRLAPITEVRLLRREVPAPVAMLAHGAPAIRRWDLGESEPSFTEVTAPMPIQEATVQAR